MTKETWAWTEAIGQLDDDQRAALATAFSALINGHLSADELVGRLHKVPGQDPVVAPVAGRSRRGRLAPFSSAFDLNQPRPGGIRKKIDTRSGCRRTTIRKKDPP
jgi:hypothetical protein